MNILVLTFFRILAWSHRFKLYLLGRLPIYITVTGSLGKTSTKNAIYDILVSKYNVRKLYFNSQAGLPLSMLNVEGYYRENLFPNGLIKAISTLLFDFKRYDYEIIEIGISQKGNMDDHIWMLKGYPYKYSVLTCIDKCHTEGLGSIENIAVEKTKLTNNSDEFKIINLDDPLSVSHTNKDNKTYYVTNKQDVYINYPHKDRTVFVRKVNTSVGEFEAELEFRGEICEIKIKNDNKYLSQPYGKIFASSVIIGILCGITFEESCKSLEKYSVPTRRNNFTKGKLGSLILDDAYNASINSILSVMDSSLKLSKDTNKKNTLILGDIWDMDANFSDDYNQVYEKCLEFPDDTEFLFLGDNMKKYVFNKLNTKNKKMYKEIKDIKLTDFLIKDRLVLLKGANQWHYEDLMPQLMENNRE